MKRSLTYFGTTPFGIYMAMLTRYWFRFKDLSPFSRLALGCGITAFDQDDAMAILREQVFKKLDLYPQVGEILSNVDIRQLDQKHVIPNMEPPNWRGVWFPRGF